jgi:hypothetical protein
MLKIFFRTHKVIKFVLHYGEKQFQNFFFINIYIFSPILTEMWSDIVTKQAITQILHYYLIIGHKTFPHGIESMFVIFDCDIESNKSKIV